VKSEKIAVDRREYPRYDGPIKRIEDKTYEILRRAYAGNQKG
jgi:hypothetical protein